MNKIFALYKNELIKTSRKVSIIIFMVVIILGCFGLGGVMKFIEIQSKTDNSILTQLGQDPHQYFKSDMETQMQSQKDSIASLDSQIAALTDTPENQSQLADLREQKASANDQVEMLQIAIDKGIYINFESNYLTRALNDLAALKPQIRALESTPKESRDDAWQKILDYNKQLLAAHLKVLDEQNFQKYVQIMTDSIKNNTSMLDSEKDNQIEFYSLWYKIDPTGGFGDANLSYNAPDIAQRVGDMRRSIRDKMNYINNRGIATPMNPGQVSDMENQLAVTMYQIDHHIVSNVSGMDMRATASSMVFGFGLFMIVLMMLVLAGSAVSSEISTGSIKSLIIAPVKRWKIFTAKVLSLLTVSIASLLVLYTFGMLSLGLFFGFGSAADYVYASNGVAASFPAALFQLLSLLVSYIDIVVYMSLALMLSVLGRNTALAVGLSIATYFGGSVVQSFLMMLPSFEWMKFIPFNNLNLVNRFFPFSADAMYSGMTVSSNQPTLIFSLIYLAVFVFCMTYTAMDSFNRRDLK